MNGPTRFMPRLSAAAPRRTADQAAPAPTAHLVGLCGTGMKALAEVLADQGWTLSGSDLQPAGRALADLLARGVRFEQGHAAANVPAGADLVIYSPAVPESNPERQAAATLGIEQIPYQTMLSRLMMGRQPVCVAGTHGKSTTTAMVGSILQGAGLSPTVVCGAELLGSNRNGWAGRGLPFVVESCEYQEHFLEYAPRHAAILNVEPDHFDCFGSLEQLEGTFARFAGRVAGDGALLVRADCASARRAAQAAKAPVTTFGLAPEADWRADDVRRTAYGSRFRVYQRGQFFGEFEVSIPGRHNVLNGLAAVALSHLAGATARQIRDGLADFLGTRRRFEMVGSWRGITLIDDYAHHPTAVTATLQTARQVFGNRRLWCAFQPHQLSRLLPLMDDFAASLALADRVLVAPVFSARERGDARADEAARELARRIDGMNGSARFSDSLDRIILTIDHEARPGDVLVTMGAGTVDRVHHEFTRRVQRHSGARRAAGPLHVDEAGRARSVLPHSA